MSKYGYRCEGRKVGELQLDCKSSLYGLILCAMHHGRAQPDVGLASPAGIDGEVVKGKVVQYGLTVVGFEGPGDQVGLGRLRLVLGSIESFRSDDPPVPCRHRRPGGAERVSH
jgi:hypothetical protein